MYVSIIMYIQHIRVCSFINPFIYRNAQHIHTPTQNSIGIRRRGGPQAYHAALPPRPLALALPRPCRRRERQQQQPPPPPSVLLFPSTAAAAAAGAAHGFDSGRERVERGAESVVVPHGVRGLPEGPRQGLEPHHRYTYIYVCVCL